MEYATDTLISRQNGTVCEPVKFVRGTIFGGGGAQTFGGGARAPPVPTLATGLVEAWHKANYLAVVADAGKKQQVDDQEDTASSDCCHQRHAACLVVSSPP
jgi:hypothetical protein